VAIVLLLACAPGARGDGPLSTADVVRFLRAGISEHTILTELGSRGFGEALDQTREAALREAGASETLIVALRRAAPAEKAPSPSPGAVSPRPAGDSSTFANTPKDVHAPTFSASTRTVRVPVSVVDKGGQPVMGLRADDFQVSEDGKRRAVTLFSGERRPLRIALALDLSRSMMNKIRQVEEALRHFIDVLEPADEIMVITFSDDVQVVQDFTADREVLGRVLDMLEPDGGTALYDAASEAIRRVAAGPAESKAVVLVTDGVDTVSVTSFERLRELARRSEVPVFSIGLGGDSGLPTLVRRPGGMGPGGGGPGWPGGPGGGPGVGIPRGFPGGRGGFGGRGGSGGGGRGVSRGMRPEGFDARPLTELADETGGQAVIIKEMELAHYTPGSDAPGSTRLKEAVESIAMTLRHRYLLGYEPPDGKAGWRTIKVDVDRPATSTRSRKGYYARG
jgi:VWFA-related protein